jgi:hypothetical protein
VILKYDYPTGLALAIKYKIIKYRADFHKSIGNNHSDKISGSFPKAGKPYLAIA